MSGATSANDVPTHWYNILGDLPFEFPSDLPAPVSEMTEPVKPQLPLALVRQSVSVARHIEIPADVGERYQT
jgi:tryptophan synthase beta chain